MTPQQRIENFVRDTAALRALIIETEDPDVAARKAVTYALAACWIAEFVEQAPGYRKIIAAIGGASQEIITQAFQADLDRGLEELLAGRENPEVEGDGA